MPLEGTVDVAIWLTLRSILLDSTIYGNIPQNSGLTRPITIVAPRGSLANPIFPAPVIARFCPGNQLADTVMKALAQAVPKQVSAGIGNLRVIAFSGLNEGQHWVHMEILEGSYGGRYGLDGMDAVDTLYANTRNNPIEDIELHLPLRVNRYELRDDVLRAGQVAGRHRLGARVQLPDRRRLRRRGRRATNTGRGASRAAPTAAVADAEAPRPRTAAKPTSSRRCPITRSRPATASSRTDPAAAATAIRYERAPEAVLDDVLDGHITAAAAREQYGVVLTGERVDPDATARLRGERAPSASRSALPIPQRTHAYGYSTVIPAFAGMTVDRRGDNARPIPTPFSSQSGVQGRAVEWANILERLATLTRSRVQELVPAADEIGVLVHEGVPHACARHALEMRAAFAAVRRGGCRCGRGGRAASRQPGAHHTSRPTRLR